MACHWAKSQAILDWAPLGESMDLVEGNLSEVASATAAEVRRFAGRFDENETVDVRRTRFESLDSVFRSVKQFTNTPTRFVVIPTRSRWTVVWTNTFACDGYDSLCHCLTLHHGLTTLHWRSSDVDSFSQAGSLFTHRVRTSGEMEERCVYCAREDRRWIFRESGEPLPEEDMEAYARRLKRERLNEERMTALLARLGAAPWQDDFYDFSQKAVVIRRINYPSAILTVDFEYIKRRTRGEYGDGRNG